MKSALVTLLPMFAAAGLVLFGGERLAGRESEERISADRERLVDFSVALEHEVERLEQTYLGHLDELAGGFVRGQPAPEEQARGIVGVAALHLFTTSFSSSVSPRKDELLVARPDPGTPRLPEVELEGRKTPLNPEKAVIFPKEFIDDHESGSHGWLNAPGGIYRISWHRPDPVRLVAIVVCSSDVRDAADRHLQSWMKQPMAPLIESGEQIAVQGATKRALVANDSSDRGPAALVMPVRTSLGEWQIQAWDRVKRTSHRDPATLAAAGAMAGILALAGIILFVQQRRALHLAEQRVSFVNRVSHELGAPLTNLALNVDLAREALDSGTPEAGHRLGIVTEEIERLCRLVANVLTFSHRERQTLKLDPQPCMADAVIDKVLDSFRPALDRRGIEVGRQAAAGDRVRLDPDALGQIVGNLISNVEKYGASGHSLKLTSRLADGILTVRVSDLGPGVPPAARARIFEPFERARETVNEGASGTGLGLAIANDLAQRMGGSLKLAETDRGATFALRLPAPPVLAVVADDESSAA